MKKSTMETLFATNEDKSKNGVWETYGTNPDGTEFRCLIAEAGNPRHEKAQRKFAKALERTRRNDKKRQEVLAKIIAISILLDWEFFLDENGNQIKATTKNKIEALVKYKKFFAEVLDFATDETNYRDDDEEIDLDVEDDLADLTPEEDTEKN